MARGHRARRHSMRTNDTFRPLEYSIRQSDPVGDYLDGTEYDGSRRRKVASDSVGAAIERYKMWHQKEPDRVDEHSYQFPEQVRCMGRAVEILYESDKWEDDGEMYDYVHRFDSRPFLYGVEGAGEVKSVCKLLRIDDINGRISMATLAGVLQLMWEDDEGNPHQKVFDSHKPLMTCTNDRKTIVIFTARGPLFVNGEAMTVTERGIVK